MKKVLFLAAICLFMTACKKDDPSVSKDLNINLNVHPESNGVTFQAEIENIQPTDIQLAGFIWGKKLIPEIGDSGTFVFKDTTSDLHMSYSVTSGLQKDSTYYVRAFYQDKQSIYKYSEPVSFKSSGTKQPFLKYLSKTFTWNDEVELSLDTLKINDLDNIDIKINSLVIKPGKISGSKIYFTIPNELQATFNNSLSVVIYGQESNSTPIYFSQPVVTATSSKNLKIGQTLILEGQFFHPDASRNTVSIGTSPLQVVSATATQLQVKLNNLDFSTIGRLTVETGGELTFKSGDDYTLYKYFSRKQDFPGVARTQQLAFAVNENIYIGLGWSSNTGLLNDWWKYDTKSDEWTRLKDSPQGIMGSQGFVIGNKIYVVMGTRGTGSNAYGSNDTYVYDVVANTWTTAAAFPGKYIRNYTTFNSDKFGYIFGGSVSMPNIFKRIAEVWRFDPIKNLWTQLADFPGTAREEALSFVIGNKAYTVGGSTQDMSNLSKETWSFNFDTETWNKLQDTPQEAGSYYGFSFAAFDKGYIGGGGITGVDAGSNFIYEFDPATNNWIKKDYIVDPIKYEARAVSIDNVGYLFCGDHSVKSSNFGSKSFLLFKP